MLRAQTFPSVSEMVQNYQLFGFHGNIRIKLCTVKVLIFRMHKILLF